MDNESPTRAYFFDGKIEKSVFVKDTIKNFIHAKKNQLMLFYREDISRTEIRYITHKITKGIRKQNPDALIEVESRIPTDAFEALRVLINMMEADDCTKRTDEQL